jgi:multidrug efflux pump subunit AcrA (membrane-fusion protein)
MLLCGCVIGLTLTLSACGEDEKVQLEPPRSVRTVIAKPSVVDQEVVQTGEIEAHVETDLGFRIDGRVTTRNV